MIEKVRGFRDSFPEDMVPRQRMFDIMRQTANKFCFSPIDIPSLEYLELYKIKSGDELLTQTFSFKDKGGRELTLIPEATPSVVRMLTARKDIRKPVRWFCLPKLWRYEEPQSGRSREHTQFNADIFGDESLYADAEIISLACATLDKLGLCGTYKVRVNNRFLMEKILERVGIKQISKGYSLIDHFKKISKEEFEKELMDLSDDKEMLLALTELLGTEIKLSELDKKFPETFKSGNEEIIFRLMNTAKLVSKQTDAELVYDASVVRGLGYYTGIVFEGFDIKGEFRSIFGGGRYDNLCQLLSGTSMEAVGFGMGDAVLELLLRRNNNWDAEVKNNSVVFCALSKEAIDMCFSLVKTVREYGYSTTVDTSMASISNQLKKAGANGMGFAAILGPKELEDKKITIRNMKTGKQAVGSFQDLIQMMLELSEN